VKSAKPLGLSAVVPAQAGTHRSTVRAPARWIPVPPVWRAGMTGRY